MTEQDPRANIIERTPTPMQAAYLERALHEPRLQVMSDIVTSLSGAVRAKGVDPRYIPQLHPSQLPQLLGLDVDEADTMIFEGRLHRGMDPEQSRGIWVCAPQDRRRYGVFTSNTRSILDLHGTYVRHGNESTARSKLVASFAGSMADLVSRQLDREEVTGGMEIDLGIMIMSVDPTLFADNTRERLLAGRIEPGEQYFTHAPIDVTYGEDLYRWMETTTAREVGIRALSYEQDLRSRRHPDVQLTPEPLIPIRTMRDRYPHLHSNNT